MKGIFKKIYSNFYGKRGKNINNNNNKLMITLLYVLIILLIIKFNNIKIKYFTKKKIIKELTEFLVIPFFFQIFCYSIFF